MLYIFKTKKFDHDKMPIGRNNEWERLKLHRRKRLIDRECL